MSAIKMAIDCGGLIEQIMHKHKHMLVFIIYLCLYLYFSFIYMNRILILTIYQSSVFGHTQDNHITIIFLSFHFLILCSACTVASLLFICTRDFIQ